MKPIKIRIQPQEMKPPEKEPFKYDLLGRKEPAEILTQLVRSIEGPCVLSVDEAWGQGKTVFLRMWAQYLRNEKFPVIEFNAWKTDFTKIPFVALYAELTESIREKYKDTWPEVQQYIDRICETGQKVAGQIFSGAIQAATGGTVNIEKAMTSYALQRLSEYARERGIIAKFTETLEDTAKTLSGRHEGLPLMVMIDELDRCRPSYAVEFLETAKHLFAADRIIFVLAVNREQMAHSVRALYGADFDAQKYLYRFFDLDFKLPAPDRADFINALLKRTDIKDYFERIQDPDARKNSGIVEKLLRYFFQTYDVSPRDMEQAVHRLGLVFSSLPDKYRGFLPSVTVALILRTIDQGLYSRFIRNKISDRELIEDLYKKRSGLQPGEIETNNPFFEAVIILGYLELRGKSRENGIEHSPLWERRHLDVTRDAGLGSQETKKHAENVMNKIENLCQMYPEPDGVGFKYAVDRIELLSSEFRDEKEDTDKT